jgi:hypothetical protein
LGVPHIFGRKIVGGTVSPQPVHRKTIIARVSAAAAAGVALAGVAMRHAH